MTAAPAVVLVLLAAAGRDAAAQQSAAPKSALRNSPEQLLAGIREKMAATLAALPNYTCVQTTERAHRHGPRRSFETQDRIRLEVALVEGKEFFGWPGSNRIDEADVRKLLTAGAYLTGSFGTLARGIFLTGSPRFEYRGDTAFRNRRTLVFDYDVPAARSEYSITVNQRETKAGFHGSFLVDTETLDLLRLEVNADDIPRALNLEFAHNVIDYERMRIGAGDFLLPRLSELVMRDLHGDESRNRTSFSGCRQYSGESILSFADPAAQSAASSAAPAEEIQLPPQFSVDASLETPIHGDSSAIGDPVSLRLKSAIKSKGGILAPKGATIRGHVLRLERTADSFLLRLGLETLELENGRADLRARNIQCSVADVNAPNSAFRGQTDAGAMVFSANRLDLPRGFSFSLRTESGKAERPPAQEPVSPATTVAVDVPREIPPPAPVLKAETAAVVVDVIVTDRKGRHAPGLSAADFKLYEDNTPQAISSFTPPLERAGRRKATDDRGAASATGSGPPASPKPAWTPQLITLLIDLGDLHSDSLKRACAAASTFARKTIAAGNLIAVYWVDSSLRLGAPFTRDSQRAADVIRKLSGHVPAGAFTARDRELALNELDAMKQVSGAFPTTPGGGPAPPDPMAQARNMMRTFITTANALQARTVFVALRAMALAYGEIPGRKAVVLFSEGFLHALDGWPEMQAVIDAANRGQVAIYVIDASGTTVNAPDRFDKNNNSVEKRSYDRPDSTPDTGEGPPGRVAGGLGSFDWAQTLGSDRHGDLGGIAAATGGFLVQDTNDLDSALDRIEDDAREFYTLVYSPMNHNYDGSFRGIKVELAKRGYHARYRRGYWALPPGLAVQ